jgi:hypothetical protein
MLGIASINPKLGGDARWTPNHRSHVGRSGIGAARRERSPRPGHGLGGAHERALDALDGAGPRAAPSWPSPGSRDPRSRDTRQPVASASRISPRPREQDGLFGRWRLTRPLRGLCARAGAPGRDHDRQLPPRGARDKGAGRGLPRALDELCHTGQTGAAKAFKNARWSPATNPDDLTDHQAATLAALQTAGGKAPRASAHEETVREIFKPGLTVATVAKLVDRLLARLSRSRLSRS